MTALWRRTSSLAQPVLGIGLVAAATVFYMSMVGGCSTIAPGHDPFVVRAEQTTEIAFDLLDTFLRWEYAHRKTLPPEVTEAAERIREKAPDAIRIARELTRAYKRNRTEEGRVSMMSAVAVLDDLIATAQRYLATQGGEQ